MTYSQSLQDMIATNQAALLVDQALLREAQDQENNSSGSSSGLTVKEVKKEVKEEEKSAKLAIKVTNTTTSYIQSKSNPIELNRI